MIHCRHHGNKLLARPAPRRRRAIIGVLLLAASVAALSGCGGSSDSQPAMGEQLFKTALQGTNGRSCASCHVPEDNFTLTPARVSSLLASNPKDPLFAAIDADDPKATTLTFEHLKKGLVRVWLTLPDNMDMIDAAGNVVTPADRRFFVWRGVPSVADVALTAPYQLDGRESSLETQAQGAISSHSEGGQFSASDLRLIADFQKTVFTSDRARLVAEKLSAGVAIESITDPDDTLVLNAEETRGRDVFKATCAACHGGATKNRITDRKVHAQSFPKLKTDGTVQYQVPATDPPTLTLVERVKSEFINIASAVENYLAQIGKAVGQRFTEHVSFTEKLSYPQYRFRFYKDATRTTVVADLPPALPTDNPYEFRVDSNGNPITGPNFTPQLFTTDPGRAAITGDPNDFEAFDVPTLRGISRTGPYWHNNISETLEAVIELYSDHLLAKYPSLSINTDPPEPDEDGDIGPVEALSKQQKKDLLSYLKRL